MKRLCALVLILAQLASVFYCVNAAKITRWWLSNFMPSALLVSDHTQNAPILSGGYLSWLDTRNKFHDTEGRIMPRIFMMDISSGEEKPCSAFTRKTPYRSMYRNISVWSENPSSQAGDDNYNIMSFDFLTGTRKVVCSAKKRQDNPQVSKEWIIWRDWRNCQSSSDEQQNSEIYGINIGNEKEFLIKDLNSQGTAELYNDYVALSLKMSDKNDYDIYIFVLATKKLLPICTAPGDQISPKIIGNTILWLDCRTCSTNSDSMITNIYGYSLSTKKEFRISSLPNREFGLTVGDRYAAWYYQPSQSFSGTVKTMIKGYDTIAGKTITITEKTGIYSNISIAGRYCVYETSDPCSDFGSDIKIFDFTTEKTYWVFRGFGDQRNPAIYGDIIAWEDHGSFDSESIAIWYTTVKNPVKTTEPQTYGARPANIWSTAHGNNQRTNFSPSQIKKRSDNPFTIQWTFDLQELSYSTPIFDKKGYAFFGVDDSKFYCLNVFDGQKAWDFQTIGKVKGSAALYMERLFFGDDKGVFYCLDSQTGQEIWRFQTGGAITGSPAVFQGDVDHYGCVAFSSSDKKLYLLNALSKTPSIKWTFDLEGWAVDAPAIDYNSTLKLIDRQATSKVIYICTSNNRLLCIDATTGRLLSELHTKNALNTSPIAYGSKVIISTSEGILIGSDFSAWGMKPCTSFKEETNHSLNGSVVYDSINDRICYEGAPGTIKCVKEKDSWTYNISEPVKATPTLLFDSTDESTVLVCCTESGKLVILDTSNGSEVAKMTLKSAVTTSISIFDTGYPSILVATKDKKIYCISQRPQQDD